MSGTRWASLTVGAGLALSTVLGYAREAAIAAVFGASAVTDAYFTANILPNVLYNILLGGGIVALFIPIFSKARAEGEERARRVADALFGLLLAISVVASAIILVTAPLLIRLAAPEFMGERFDLATQLTRIVAIMPIFFGTAAFLGAVLNSFDRFAAAAFGFALNNTVVVLSVFTLGRWIGVYGLAAGAILGLMAQVALLVPAVHSGGYLPRPRLDLSLPEVRRTVLLALPLVGTLVLSQLGYVVERIFASGLAEGSVTALYFARRLASLPHTVGALALGTAALPVLSRLTAAGDREGLRRLISTNLRSMGLIMLPATIFLVVLAQPIVSLVFERAAFEASDSRLTAAAVMAFGAGTLGAGYMVLLQRILWALGDTVSALATNALGLILHVILAWVLTPHLGVVGISTAFSIASLVTVLTTIWAIHFRTNSPGLEEAWIFAKILFAAVLLAVAAYVTYEGAEELMGGNSLPAQTFRLMAAGGVAMLVYTVVLHGIGFREPDQALRQVIKWTRKSS